MVPTTWSWSFVKRPRHCQYDLAWLVVLDQALVITSKLIGENLNLTNNYVPALSSSHVTGELVTRTLTVLQLFTQFFLKIITTSYCQYFINLLLSS